MPATASNDPLIGTLLDNRYDVISRIARGGMATVYLGLDRRLDREVAVKVMHAHMVDDEQFVARFIREAKSAARISHPNVVNVFDQGREGDVLYLVMEYVRGMTLRDVLNQSGALTPGQMLDVLIPVLDALAAASRAGIVHRDVKPENVLLADDGGVKVADFGLARAVANSGQTSSSTGTLIGTPAYLSPELITRGVADVRSDVYSAGIMVYEMLTGHPPYEGGIPVQVAFRHVNETVPAPSAEQPGLPASLDQLVLHATAQDPDERPRDAAEYAVQARQVQHNLTEDELDREPVEAATDGSTAAEATRTLKPRSVRQASHFPTRVDALNGSAPMATQRFHRAPGRPSSPTRRLPDVTRDQAHAVRPQVTFPQDDTPARRRRRAPMILAVLLAVVAIAGVGGWYMLAGPGAYATVPTVGGNRQQAESTLTAAGFKPSFTTAYSESVKSGQVITTDPHSGSKVHKNAVVNVSISRGTAWTTMPRVVGLSLDSATRTLRAQDISVPANPQQSYHDTIAQGSVVSSDPSPAGRVQRGSRVNLVVSKGPAPVTVPNLSGQSQSDSRRRLTSLGLHVKVAKEYSETSPKGAVITQEPAAGGQAKRGDTVTITVSLGPPLVTVPNVVGKQVEEARSALTAAGFQVSVNNVMGGYFGTVRSQDPGPNARVPKGSTITLTVV